MKHSLPISFLICMLLLGCVAAKETTNDGKRPTALFFTGSEDELGDSGLITDSSATFRFGLETHYEMSRNECWDWQLYDSLVVGERPLSWYIKDSTGLIEIHQYQTK